MKTFLFTLILALSVNLSFAQYNIFWGDKANATITSSSNDMDLSKVVASDITDASRVKIDAYNQKI